MNLNFLWHRPAWALLLLYQINFLSLPFGVFLAFTTEYEVVVAVMFGFLVLAAPAAFYLGWLRREATVTWIAGSVLILALPAALGYVCTNYTMLALTALVAVVVLGSLYLCAMCTFGALFRTAMKQEVKVLGCGANHHDAADAGTARAASAKTQQRLVRNVTIAAISPWFIWGGCAGLQWLSYEITTPPSVKLCEKFKTVLISDYDRKQIKAYLSAGADIETESDEGTPLSLACDKGDEQMVAYLLAHGADVNGACDPLSKAIGTFDCSCDSDKREPPSAARERIALSLLAHGAKIDNEHSKRALIDAVWKRYSLKLIKALISAGGDVSSPVRDADGTPLIAAISTERTEVIDLLFQKSVDLNRVDAQTSRPGTALHAAGKMKNVALMQRLIEAGADVGLKDGSGRTALSYARERQYDDIVKVLLDTGATIQ
jgi:hypothetical protein